MSRYVEVYPQQCPPYIDRSKNRDLQSIFTASYRKITESNGTFFSGVKNFISTIFITLINLIRAFFTNIPDFLATSTEGKCVFIVGSCLIGMVLIVSLISFIVGKFKLKNIDPIRVLSHVCNVSWMSQTILFIFHGYKLSRIYFFEKPSVDINVPMDFDLEVYKFRDCKRSFYTMIISIVSLIAVYIALRVYKYISNQKMTAKKFLAYGLMFFALNIFFGVLVSGYSIFFLRFSAQLFRLLQIISFLFLKLGFERT